MSACSGFGKPLRSGIPSVGADLCAGYEAVQSNSPSSDYRGTHPRGTQGKVRMRLPRSRPRTWRSSPSAFDQFKGSILGNLEVRALFQIDKKPQWKDQPVVRKALWQ